MAAQLLPTFQARIHEMEENRCILLHRLQVEKELHQSKNLELLKHNKVLSKIRRRCLSLKQKEADLYVKLLEKEDELKTVNQTLAEVTLKQRTLSSDLGELQHREKERRELYKQKRDMMDAHKIRLQDYMRNLKSEMNSLRKTVSQLEKRAKEIQKNSSIMGGIVNENIPNEEKIKSDLSAHFSDNYDAFEARMPDSNMERELDNRIHLARKEIEQKKKTLEGQRMVLIDLQTQNQSLENRVFEAMQLRDQKKRLVGNAQ